MFLDLWVLLTKNGGQNQKGCVCIFVQWTRITQYQTNSSPSLRSFNYLMQDARIMLGHHLKESQTFICWDGSGTGEKREVRLSAMKPADVFFKGTLICVSFFLCLWYSVLFLFPGGVSWRHCSEYHFLSLFRGAVKAQRRLQVVGKGLRRVNSRETPNSNFTFQRLLFTGFHLWDLLSCFDLC